MKDGICSACTVTCVRGGRNVEETKEKYSTHAGFRETFERERGIAYFGETKAAFTRQRAGNARRFGRMMFATS